MMEREYVFTVRVLVESNDSNFDSDESHREIIARVQRQASQPVHDYGTSDEEQRTAYVRTTRILTSPVEEFGRTDA